MSLEPLASPPDALARFVETEDWMLLEKPLIFQKTTNFTSYQCCLGAAAALGSFGVSALFCPIGACCPGIMNKNFHLRVDQHAVQMNAAYNDFCCHIATIKKTVPLEKIQDVQVEQNCIHSCFGVKSVNIETAGQGTQGPEIVAVFLEDPDRARVAIQTAVKLQKQGAVATTAPGQVGAMSRDAPLAMRLAMLELLVQRGVLSGEEAASVRVGVLAAERDPTPRLREAADLFDRKLITPEEFGALKGALLSQLGAGPRQAWA